MKREAILGLLAIVAICSVVFIAGCNERHTSTPTPTPTPSPTPTPPANTKTYDKFGFSFDYPADMTVMEMGEVNEESGTITLTSTTKPRGATITWGRLGEEERSEKAMEEAMDSSLASSDVICQANREKRTHLGHTVIEQRYVLKPYSVFSEGWLYCDKSKRGFIVGAWRLPEDAGIKVDTGSIEMLLLEKDPVYKDYREIIDSFRCHKTPTSTLLAPSATTAQTITPGSDVERHIRLGDLFLRSGRYEEAAEEFREAIKLEPNEILPYAGLGKSLIDLERYCEAKPVYEIILRLVKEQGYDQQVYELENRLRDLELLCNVERNRDA
jgi:tetratricopeptide (TPR) repeat protein